MGKHSAKKRRHLAVKIVAGALVVVLVGVGAAYAWWRSSIEEGRRAMTEAVTQRVQEQEGTIEYDGKRWVLNEDVVLVCFIGYDNTGDEENEYLPR